MPLTFHVDFDTAGKVGEWYYTPNTLAGVGNLRLATDGVDDFIEIEFGTPPVGTVGFVSKAAMDADLNHPAGTTAYAFDSAAANHGRYTKTGSSGSGSWGSRVGNIQDKAWPDQNHTRVAWLELLFETWEQSATYPTEPVADPAAVTGKVGWGHVPDLRGAEFRYSMRAKNLLLGEHAKICQHVQTQVPALNLWPDDEVQQAWVNALQIADPISDQLGFGTGGYYAANPVRGVADSGWVDVRVPLNAVDSEWLMLGSLDGRQGISGEAVNYFNYIVTSADTMLGDWTGNAYMVAAHKVVDAATKATAPADDVRIRGTLQIRSASIWTP